MSLKKTDLEKNKASKLMDQMRHPGSQGRFGQAAAPVLDDEDFYRHCRALLTDEGVMTVNLFGRDSSYERSLARICAAFGSDAVWAFKPTREGNTVVLALRTPQWPTRMQLLARAETIQARWGLPALKWLKLFKPVA